jgi:hypothetical protein
MAEPFLPRMIVFFLSSEGIITAEIRMIGPDFAFSFTE